MSNIRLVVLQDQILALVDAVGSDPDALERLRLLRKLDQLWVEQTQRMLENAAFQASQAMNLADAADRCGYSTESLRKAVHRYKDRQGIPRFVKKTVPTDLDFSERLRLAKELTSHPTT